MRVTVVQVTGRAGDWVVDAGRVGGERGRGGRKWSAEQTWLVRKRGPRPRGRACIQRLPLGSALLELLNLSHLLAELFDLVPRVTRGREAR